MVPTSRSSGTTRNSLKIVVVVANEPMPSVSRKSVTNPIAIWIGDGRSSPRASLPILLAAARLHPMMTIPAITARITSSVVRIAMGADEVYARLREGGSDDVDGRAEALCGQPSDRRDVAGGGDRAHWVRAGRSD